MYAVTIIIIWPFGICSRHRVNAFSKTAAQPGLVRSEKKKKNLMLQIYRFTFINRELVKRNTNLVVMVTSTFHLCVFHCCYFHFCECHVSAQSFQCVCVSAVGISFLCPTYKQKEKKWTRTKSPVRLSLCEIKVLDF